MATGHGYRVQGGDHGLESTKEDEITQVALPIRRATSVRGSDFVYREKSTPTQIWLSSRDGWIISYLNN